MHDQHLAGREVGQADISPAARARRPPGPVSRSTKRSGNGKRRSGRRCSTRSIRAPTIAGSSPRRTVSTSGSSGIPQPLKRRELGYVAIRPPPPLCIAPRKSDSTAADGGRDGQDPFRLRSVPLAEKQERVNDVFHTVARRYDLMNDLMSAGLHRAWKDALVTRLKPPKRRPFRHLDVAGGTGDSPSASSTPAGRRPTSRCSTSTATCSRVGRERAGARHEGRHRLRRGERRGAAVPGASRSTPIRSPSASATCRASRRRSPRRYRVLQAAAGASSASSSRRSTCRASTRSTTPIRSTSSRALGRLVDRRCRVLPLSRRIDPPLPAARRRSRA